MGPHRAAALSVLLLVAPASAMEPGWTYSPLPGEGDRASLGCDSKASATSFTCIGVRCEDDFSVALYIHSEPAPPGPTRWTLTIDRENLSLDAAPTAGPYAQRVAGNVAPLLERLEQGTFVYLRRDDAQSAPFAFIDLAGSLRAIREALYWCAPKGPGDEQIEPSGVVQPTHNGEAR